MKNIFCRYLFNKISKNKGCKESGFTLLELIIVIILLGVMAVGITGFITLSTQTYLNVTERDELLASARFAVERLNREVRNALPNSLRVKTNVDTNKQCLEFIPIQASTTYIDIPVVPDDKSGDIDLVEFTDVSGNPYNCDVGCSDYLVVYPLKPSDVYDFNVNSGEGKVTQFKNFVNLAGDIWTIPIEPNAGMVFDEHSPTNRVYIFDVPVAYCLTNFELRRYEGHDILPSQELVPTTGSNVLMAENLNFYKNDLPFKVLPATLQRNAMVQIKLDFDRDGETVSFNNDIHINNMP